MKKENDKTSNDTAAENFPGVAVNVADNNKDTEKLVKERTEILNDNPRNNDL